MRKCAFDGKEFGGPGVMVFLKYSMASMLPYEYEPTEYVMCVDHGKDGGNVITEDRHNELQNKK